MLPIGVLFDDLRAGLLRMVNTMTEDMVADLWAEEPTGRIESTLELTSNKNTKKYRTKITVTAEIIDE